MTETRSDAPTPRTLMEAHDLLTRMRPKRAASSETWLRYYRRSAVVYAEVAEIDRGHHHEALYWANRERAKASKLQAGIKNLDPPVVETIKEGASGKGPDTTVHTEL